MNFLRFILPLPLLFAVYSSSVLALPSLQLGAGGTGDWVPTSSEGEYDGWVVTDSGFTLNAYANADCKGCGDYAWDSSVSDTDPLYAYLVAAAAPKTSELASFGITVDGATFVTDGVGSPPIQDDNALAGHGVYDTYYQVYEFVFDRDTLGEIFDQQEGETGTGDGYTHTFNIDVDFLAEGIGGVHFDLFTVSGQRWDWDSLDTDKQLVSAFAPWSHDAEYKVPEPGMVGLLAIGLIAMVVSRRRMKI